MPYPDDPYAIPPPEDPSQQAPWLPEWWNYAGPPEHPTIQPGLGIPTSVIDPLDPDPIEMPAHYAGTPTLSQPRPPVDNSATAIMAAQIAKEPRPESVDNAAEPLPIPGPPDAVSAGTVPYPGAELAPSELASERMVEPQDAREQYTPREQAQQFAAMSPEDQWMAERDWLAGRDAEARKRQDAIDLETRNAQVENQRIVERAFTAARQQRQQLDEETRQLGETNIDPDRWWNSRDTGQKIAGYISAILGGLVSGKRGGPNTGIAMIERAIDQDIDAQKANLANKRASLQARGASVDQMLALEQEHHALTEKARIASYTYQMNRLAADMAQYDPAGKNAIETGRMMNELAASRQKALADFEDRTYKQQVEAYKAAADYEKTQAEIRKLNAETGKITGSIGGGGAGAGKEIKPAEHYAMLGLPKPPMDMTEKDYKSWLASKSSAASLEKTEQETANSAASRTAGDLVNDDGTPIKFASPGLAERIAKKRAAVDNAGRIIDQLLNEIEAEGWSSDTMKSPSWRRAQSDAQSLYIQLKNDAELGVLAGPDMEILEKMSGGDPTQIRSTAPSLKQLRHNMTENFNSEVKASASAGSKPKRYLPPKLPSAPATEKTADDQTFARALNSNAGSYEAFLEDMDATPRDRRPPGTSSDNDRYAYYYKTAADPMKRDEWVSPGIQAKIDQWASMARSAKPLSATGEQGPNEKALGYLNELSTRGGTPAIRRAAAAALSSALSSSSESVGPVTSTARETVPGAR